MVAPPYNVRNWTSPKQHVKLKSIFIFDINLIKITSASPFLVIIRYVLLVIRCFTIPHATDNILLFLLQGIPFFGPCFVF